MEISLGARGVHGDKCWPRRHVFWLWAGPPMSGAAVSGRAAMLPPPKEVRPIAPETSGRCGGNARRTR